jgi:hypothetical protein
MPEGRRAWLELLVGGLELLVWHWHGTSRAMSSFRLTSMAYPSSLLNYSNSGVSLLCSMRTEEGTILLRRDGGWWSPRSFRPHGRHTVFIRVVGASGVFDSSILVLVLKFVPYDCDSVLSEGSPCTSAF